MPVPRAEDERRPLLNGHSKHPDNGTVERDGPSSRPDLQQQQQHEEEQAVAEEEGPTTAELVRVMASIWLGTFLAGADSTLIATLSGPISSEFGSLSLLAWLASGYFIANAALQPLSGKLTDIFGRRAGLILSNVFFSAGNLICGLAQDQWVIIAGRVIAGMGGGGLNSISTFVASDLIPLRRRGAWQGFGNLCYGVGAGIGGVLGGVINDSIGWRWAFIIQVPFTVVSIFLVIFTVKIPVKDTGKNRWKRIDYLGAILLVSTLVLLLIGLDSGGNVVPWTHPLVLATLPLSAVALAAYFYVELRVASEPIIPVRLLLNRTPLAACLTNWFTTMGLFGMLFYVPIFFQVQGHTATEAGERLIPHSVGIAVGSLVVGLTMRRLGRYWWLNVGIETTLVVAFALISTLNMSTPDWAPFIFFLLSGMGYSGMLTCTLIALISAVEHKFQAVITSASYAFRSTGSTIGITIASAVFQNILSAQLWTRLGDREDAGELIPRVRASLGAISDLPDDLRFVVQDCYGLALRSVFLTLLALIALGGLASLFMREHRLHTTISRRESR